MVNNEVVKETVYDKFVAKVNATDNSCIALKTQYNTDKSDLEKKINDADNKITDTSELVKKTDYSSKISEIESTIHSITGLATTAALTAVINKIPDVSNLVEKTYYDAKISCTESRYFTTADYYKFTSQTLDARIKQKELFHKSAIAGFKNNADLVRKIAILVRKAELNAKQNEITKLQAFDSSYFRGKSHFEDDGTQ